MKKATICLVAAGIIGSAVAPVFAQTAGSAPKASSVSRTTASQPLAIASSSSPDRQRPWARISGMRRIDMGRVYEAAFKPLGRVDMNDSRRQSPLPWPRSP